VSAPLLLKAGRALVDGAVRDDVDVLLADGVVNAVGPDLAVPPSTHVLELSDGLLAPGYVDLHVHALDGHGLVGAGSPDVPGLARALATRGVTSFLATTTAAPVAELVQVLAGLADGGAGARCLGAHLEGPWLAAAKAGAQPRDALALPSLTDLERLLAAGPVVMLTLAPELEGAQAVIARAAAAGVVVALGHSAAGYDVAGAAVAAGARHVTHCFNAMPPLHHRDPGLVGMALDRGEVTVEAIADGVHLHPAVLRLLWRACGPHRVCLVSDAVDVALPGTQAARLPDGTLAGSRVGLDACVRNAVAWGIPLADALTMGSTTPAAAIGRVAALTPGAPADVVLLDADLQVACTVVAGVPVWQR
jgi:N-acetylglucosamine-6-phosphate deacetylase